MSKPNGLSRIPAPRADQFSGPEIHRTVSYGRKRYTWRVYLKGVLLAHSPTAYPQEKVARAAFESMKGVAVKGRLAETGVVRNGGKPAGSTPTTSTPTTRKARPASTRKPPRQGRST